MIKVGIIGLGHLGSKHLRIYKELSDSVEIVGICDINESIAKKYSEEHQLPFVTDYKKLKDQVDAVCICVPTESHFEVAKFFLENQKHTFIEKPISNTIEEADQLIALAEQNKLTIQVGHIERFNTAFQSIIHFTHNPLFIECHRLNHFPNRSLDIGVVMDLMIHDIDIILGLINHPLEDVQAVGINVLTPLEDIANVRMTFSNGCVCNLTASRVSEEVMRKIRIFQKNTYISLDYVKQEAFIYKKHEQNILKHSLPIEKEEPLRKEIEHFIECINENKKPIVSGVEAKEALEVALTICQKIWDQKKNTL